MSLVRLARSPGVAAILSKVSSAALSFVFLWLVARLLPTAEAGVFLYSYSLMMILVQMSRAGTEHSMIKLIAQYESARCARGIILRTSVYSTMICLLLSAGVVFYDTLFPMTVYVRDEAAAVLHAFILVSVLVTVTQIFSSYFQARKEIYSQYWTLNIGMVLVGGVTCAVGGWLVGSAGAKGMSHAFLLANLLVLVSSVFMFRLSVRKTVATGIDYPHIGMGEIFRRTLPYAPVTFFSIATLWGGQIVAGAWLSEHELAIMTVSMRLAFLVNFLHVTFAALLAPRIARLHLQSDMQSLSREISIYTAISKVYSLGMCALFILAGDFILGLFGSDYREGYWALVIMSVGWALVSMLGPVNTILLMSENASHSRIYLLISGAVTVAGSLLLAADYSVNGIVLATAAGSLLLPLLCAVRVYRLFRAEFISPTVTVQQCSMLLQAARKLSGRSAGKI